MVDKCVSVGRITVFNLQKMTRDYTKFFTPPKVADFMVELLEPQAGEVILEPSAGNGNLVRAVKEKCPASIVFACEWDNKWHTELKKSADVVVIKDFMKYPKIPKHSKCIANPPFGNGVDLEAHVNRMMDAVVKGGRLIILVPDDFNPEVDHVAYHVENWSKNSDGTTTPIKIIEITNP